MERNLLIGAILTLAAIGLLTFYWVTEPARMTAFEEKIRGEAVERGEELFAENCAICHGESGEGGVGPRLNSREFLDRATDDFIFNAIFAGRPGTAMPTWGERLGGILRDIQISDLVSFIRHWESTAPVITATPTPAMELSGADIFQNMGCYACHVINGVGGAIGPDLTDIGARADEAYIRESILDPNAVVVEGYAANIMPQNYGDRLSPEELDALVEHLTSLK